VLQIVQQVGRIFDYQSIAQVVQTHYRQWNRVYKSPECRHSVVKCTQRRIVKSVVKKRKSVVKSVVKCTTISVGNYQESVVKSVAKCSEKCSEKCSATTNKV
jgi:hypothetical protein